MVGKFDLYCCKCYFGVMFEFEGVYGKCCVKV